MSTFILADQRHGDVRAKPYDVAVLPFGATEPHNLHMPYGTDTLQVEEIGRRACEHASKAGARVVLLPALPFGVNTNHLKVPGALACSLTPTTLLAILTDLTDALSRQGVKKLLLLNGHGGNELKPLTRELHHRTDVFLCVCDWFRVAADQYPAIFEKPGEHADEVETSLGLAFFPHLLKPELADAGVSKTTKFEAINRGWVSITRPWHLATTNTGMGDPKAATAEKGRRLMEILTERIGKFLIDLAKAEKDERFPF
jgi:creatinine amidohydrolase